MTINRNEQCWHLCPSCKRYHYHLRSDSGSTMDRFLIVCNKCKGKNMSIYYARQLKRHISMFDLVDALSLSDEIRQYEARGGKMSVEADNLLTILRTKIDAQRKRNAIKNTGGKRRTTNAR